MTVRSFVCQVKKQTRMFSKIVFLTMVVSSAVAQEWPFELWHEGKIVLLEGDTLKGLVKYDLQQDMLQYTANDKKAEAYSPRKVLFFEIYDNTVRRYRQFFALPYNKSAGYLTPIFFELLAEGKLTLLSREALETRSYSSPYYIGSYSRTVLVNYYFFMNEDGKIEPFTGNKNDLLDIMEKRSEEIERFIRTNRLNIEEKYDFARIVEYYNSLFGS